MPEPCRILLAEDNGVQVVLVETILEAAGCHFTTVRNGLDALDRVKSDSFRLVLMDYHMPYLNGAQATAGIRAWEVETGRSRLPIVGITASAMPHEIQLCLTSGMDEVVIKPFDVLALRVLIDRYCKDHDRDLPKERITM